VISYICFIETGKKTIDTILMSRYNLYDTSSTGIFKMTLCRLSAPY